MLCFESQGDLFAPPTDLSSFARKFIEPLYNASLQIASNNHFANTNEQASEGLSFKLTTTLAVRSILIVHYNVKTINQKQFSTSSIKRNFNGNSVILCETRLYCCLKKYKMTEIYTRAKMTWVSTQIQKLISNCFLLQRQNPIKRKLLLLTN